jgi:hypothetical protein
MFSRDSAKAGAMAFPFSPKLAIAVTFGAVALLHAFWPQKVDGTTIILAFVAMSPWLLPMLAANFDEFAITLQGVSWKTRSRKSTAEEVKAVTPVSENQEKKGVAGGLSSDVPAFANLKPQTRKVMKTLWHFQKEFFPTDDQKRWGFVVPPAAPDFQSYLIGLSEAVSYGLVAVDFRGFCFLTEAGLSYCSQHKDSIAAENSFYTAFRGE